MALIIYRHEMPTERAPYETQCQIKHKDDIDVYVQFNKEEICPRWEFIGTFSTKLPQSTIDRFIFNRFH